MCKCVGTGLKGPLMILSVLSMTWCTYVRSMLLSIQRIGKTAFVVCFLLSPLKRGEVTRPKLQVNLIPFTMVRWLFRPSRRVT